MIQETVKTAMLGPMVEMQELNVPASAQPGQDPEAEGGLIRPAEDPQRLECRNCGYTSEMNEEMVMGCVGWSWVAVLLLLTVVLFFVPFFCGSCKDKKYNCPKCGETCSRELARCL